MILAVDTNVLVYAHLPAAQEHDKVRGYLLGCLSQPETTLVVTPLVLHEFVHVITDTRRFEPPVTMSQALGTAGLYLKRSNVTCLSMDEDVVADAFRLLERYALGRKRIADTLLVATLMRHDVHHIITCNPGHFDSFEGLTVVDPRT